MKHIVYEDFVVSFRQMALKIIRNALGFSVKPEAVLRLRKTSKTVSKATFWSFQEGSDRGSFRKRGKA